jgi:hypothetical protein
METPVKRVKVELNANEMKWLEFFQKLDWLIYEPVHSIMVFDGENKEKISINNWDMTQYESISISHINLPLDRTDEQDSNLVDVSHIPFNSPMDLLKYISAYYLDAFDEEDTETKKLKILGLYSDNYSERERMAHIIDGLSELINKDKPRRCPIWDCVGLVRFEGFEADYDDRYLEVGDSKWRILLGS